MIDAGQAEPPGAVVGSLLRKIRLSLLLFIIALIISGATAIPLAWELNLLASWFPAPADDFSGPTAATARWIRRVRDALNATDAQYPFLAYGTDWLAFAHFAIAVAFIGPMRDPVRNIWVIEFGLIVSAMVIPYALIFGQLRGIPFWWRLIDCCFGLFSLPLLWYARSQTIKLRDRHRAADPFMQAH